MPFDMDLYDKPLDELEIAVFDLETTGLSPAKDHILQIAFVPIDRGQLVGGDQEWKINPGDDVEIPVAIERLTGLSAAELRTMPPLRQVLPEFDAAVGRRVVAGHNVKGFDLRFIRRAELRVGIDVQTDYYIDTLMLSRFLRPDQRGHKLADCGRAYNLEVDEDTLHDALVDTRLCAQVLLKQITELKQKDINTFGEMVHVL